MLSDLLYRLRGLLFRQRLEDELRAELEFHLEQENEKYVRSGVPQQEADRLARIAIGGEEQIRQQCREARGTKLLEDFLQDLRYGTRAMARSPVFTITIILTLALGIGSCSAIFSIVDAVLLRPLPYGHANRLVYLFTPNAHYPNVPLEAFGPSNADFFELQKESRSYSNMTAFEQGTYSSASENVTVRVEGARVDGNFFSTLESVPETGRAIEPSDDRPGQSNVAVISHALWQSMFAETPQILSRSLNLNGAHYNIIGVMPAGFGYPHVTDFPDGVAEGTAAGTDVWVPLALTPQQKADREDSSGYAVARLKPGVSVRQAYTEMKTIMARVNLLHQTDRRGWGAQLTPLPDEAVGPAGKLMQLLAAAVCFVLLIACGNAANLLLARASSRTHEVGLRATLGAGKGRIIRQMLTESLMVGLAGGLSGIFLASAFLRGLLLLNPGNIPRIHEASIDNRTLLFTLMTAMFTSVLFGIVPAVVSSRINLAESLKTGGWGSIGGRNRVGRILIVGQLTMVVVLLLCAGLLLRSYAKVQAVQTGFSTSTISMGLQLDAQYASHEQRMAFFQTLLDRLENIPGIQAVGVINALPLSHSESMDWLWVEGYPNQKDQAVNGRAVTSQYFSAMGIRVLEGRGIGDEDRSGHPPVVVINQAFANQYFDNHSPIGRRIRLSGPADPWRTVVGVVRDVRHTSIESRPAPEVYTPLWQTDIGGRGYIAIRSALPPSEIAASAREILRNIDPNVALANITTMADLVSEANAKRKFQTILLSAFAAMALLLGVIGIYGLLTYSVKQRSREMGIRIALGATRKRVLSLVVFQGIKLAGLGLVIGLIAAMALERFLVSWLYEVSALDLMTFIIVPLLLLGITIASSVIPAVGAAKADPIRTIRCE
jgi:predicted permease